MPVRKVGNDCYQWGNQKVYCGKDAKRKAILQGIAIQNTGWREAEEIQLTQNQGLLLPSEFKETNPTFHLHEGYLLISQDREGKWRVWDMDRAAFHGWNYGTSPAYNAYREKHEMVKPHIFQFDTLQDAVAHAEWSHNKAITEVTQWIEKEEDSWMPRNFVSKSKWKVMQMQLNDQEKRDARHPNRDPSTYLPKRLLKVLGEAIRKELDHPCLQGKIFPSYAAAGRYKFYCEKYGVQPPNKLYFTPTEIMILHQGLLQPDTEYEAEMVSSSNLLLLLGVGTLGLLIPYFLDSRANKV